MSSLTEVIDVYGLYFRVGGIPYPEVKPVNQLLPNHPDQQSCPPEGDRCHPVSQNCEKGWCPKLTSLPKNDPGFILGS